MNKKIMLEQLYNQYRYLMFKVAFSILNNSSLAEDAVHAAFMKLLKNNFSIDEVTSKKTKTFMVIVARNMAIDIYNKVNKEDKKYIDDDILDITDTSPGPLELTINNEVIDKIKDTIRSMDSKYADVVILNYFYDYSYVKISSLLSISEQTVRVRIHRARRILASRLSEGGVCHEKTRIK